MLLTILFYVFVVISTINVLHFGFYLVGANFYDIQKYRQNVTAKKSRAKKPLVSVLIPAHNEELSIERCLDSVLKSSYRKLEVIVIDDASTDKTRAIVRQYIKDHPKRNVRLKFRRKNHGKGEALNHALRSGVKGDLVMTLDADSLIHHQSIANAVRYFNNPNVVGVAANVRVLDSPTVLNLLQKFEYMVAYRSKKFFSVTNSEFIIGGVASTYRKDILKKVGFYDNDIQTEDIALSIKVVAAGNKENRIVYGEDVLAMTQGVMTFKALLKQRYRWKMGSLQSIIKYRSLLGNRSKIYSRTLTWYRMPMALIGELLLLLEPLSLAYIMYLCIEINSLSLILGAYTIITIYLLWNVLPDEHMTWSNKIKMTGYTPIMYFVMYIMNIVQLISIIHCLINYKQVLRRVKTLSTWKSPERQELLHVELT